MMIKFIFLYIIINADSLQFQDARPKKGFDQAKTQDPTQEGFNSHETENGASSRNEEKVIKILSKYSIYKYAASSHSS
tara:strand:- start:3278 stop:3511 length:234 start_codon:yes stop_codon:yes gene_type:complete